MHRFKIFSACIFACIFCLFGNNEKIIINKLDLIGNQNVSLNEKDVIAEDKQNERVLKKLKNEKLNKDIVVTKFEDSIKGTESAKSGDEKKWLEDFKQRKEEWVKRIQRDPGLEESLFIMDDLIKSIKSQKLTKI